MEKNKLLKSMLCLLGLLFFGLSLSKGQSVTNGIKGAVLSNSGTPLAGVTVTVTHLSGEKAAGSLTDQKGNFKVTGLSAGQQYHLLFSLVGYVRYEEKNFLVQQGDSNSLLVRMTEIVAALDEVLVVGYGSVKKTDATGSVSTVTPDEMNKGRSLTPQDALVGKMAGVSITPGSGAPGDVGVIRIRSGASLSASNDPLIVIDGMPVSDVSISSINPNDIATFTVLKDASATAIYGSRASNGVVIITTKKGSSLKGQTPRFNYSTITSLSQVFNYVDVLSADEFREAFRTYSNAPSTYELGTGSTDWQKEIFRNAVGTDHNLSMMGTTKLVPYRLSVAYTNQNGIIRKNNYERFNGSIGLSPKFMDGHLALDINIKGSIENNEPISTGVIGGAVSFDPTRPVYETYPENVGLGYYVWMNGGSPISLAGSNPLAELNLSNKLDKVKRSIGNLSAEYKIHGLEDLKLHANVGYDVLKDDYREQVPRYAPMMYTSNQKDGTGLDYSYFQQKSNYLLDLYANYSKKFGQHNLDVMGGYGWQRFWYKNNSATNDTDGNELISPAHGEGELYLLSFYGRANYSYAQKYFLTATLRTDASSRFSPNNRWGYFPSVAAAWRLKEEGFLKEVDVLSDLKLRLSYGQTGQQSIGSYYVNLSTYSASYDEARYQFGDDWVTIYRPNGYDPNIKWETTETYNAGLDYALLGNRLTGSVDFYKRKTKDLLNMISVPAGSNFTNTIETNIGNMEGKGLEIGLTGIPFKNQNWEWSVSGNFTWNSSTITKLNTIDTDDSYVKTGNAGGTGKYLQIHQVGETPYTYFLMKQVYDEDGKPVDGRYYANDGSETSSEEDANKYVTGKSSQVPYYYGLSTKLTYKQWDLGLNAHGNFGNYVYNYMAASQSYDSFYSAEGVSSNVLKSTVDAGFTQQRLYTDYFLESGSFFRLDNLTIGYSLQNLWKKKNDFRFSLAVQNVFTITNYSGVDPEIYNGIDNSVYQRPRIFMAGINISF